jgi:hypothetical protein
VSPCISLYAVRSDDSGRTIQVVPPSLNDLAVGSPHATTGPVGRPGDDAVAECKRACLSLGRSILELRVMLQRVLDARTDGEAANLFVPRVVDSMCLCCHALVQQMYSLISKL